MPTNTLSDFQDYIQDRSIGNVTWWSFLRLSSWHLISKSSHINSQEDQVHVHEIYRYSIFRWVAETWKWWEDTRIVVLVLATKVTSSIPTDNIILHTHPHNKLSLHLWGHRLSWWSRAHWNSLKDPNRGFISCTRNAIHMSRSIYINQDFIEVNQHDRRPCKQTADTVLESNLCWQHSFDSLPVSDPVWHGNPWHAAVFCENIKIITLLLTWGYDPLQPGDLRGSQRGVRTAF